MVYYINLIDADRNSEGQVNCLNKIKHWPPENFTEYKFSNPANLVVNEISFPERFLKTLPK